MSIQNTPPLQTNRLTLRKFTQSDLPALLNIHSDKEVNKFLPMFPLKTHTDAKTYWENQYAAAYKQKQAYQYAICLKEDNIPIGYINISMNDSHDLGYGLTKKFWHQGIVTEAGKAILEQAKKDGIPFVTATHDRNNPRSGGVMIQLGMHYQYSYEEQWQPKDQLVTFRMYQLNLADQTSPVYKKYWDDSAVHFIEADVTS
ncbi:GNAT family N-acetyltransferase [Listeria booriae]|uniref:GNAT family N-acetyltransferase n=1 Tax=Listeria booriae TaxID=1552123 RepID=A0A7X0TKI4_9LIST|nr:GNAT family N-acetyltransferase [Listeria booriae]MBC1330833.1 GNAT family N-acetyltransferase [Listeria booriae]MBC2386143.1 GNAT family N-acetyltransferase [Listeria booriae]